LLQLKGLKPAREEFKIMPGTEPTDESAEAPDLTNKSVVKAMTLLRELGRHPQGITVTELAQIVGMTRPTAFRLLLSMEQVGFVDRTDNNYTLGWEMARLGRLADPTAGVAAKVQPVLESIAQEISETVSFALVKSETEYEIIAEASASRLLQVSNLYVRRQYPLHASATGKILLADLADTRVSQLLSGTLVSFTPKTITDSKVLLRQLKEIRENGYAVIDNELEEGLFAVAVGVRDSDGLLLGVVTATGPDQRMKSGRLAGIVEQLHSTAEEVGKTLE
jgi:DNA-binding IclR family transcriptional regulator